MPKPKPFVSIIVPVKNEGKFLENFLKSTKNLSYPCKKIEIIIADGQSTDNTKAVALRHNAKVVANPKQTVGPGRNIAFKKAGGEIVAFTDADCQVDKNWLKNSLKYFLAPKVAGVGGPNFTPKNETDFGKAVGFFMSQPFFLAGSIHGLNLPYVKEVKSIPGCNSIYLKQILDKVMPIDESLLTCEDTDMNQKILDLGYKLLSAPDVFVWHYQRPTPKKLWNKMYRWAIGRLQAGKKRREMINPAHIAVGLALPLLTFISLGLFWTRPFFFLAFLGLAFLFLVFWLLYCFSKTRSLRAALYLPLVIIIAFFAWSTGFLKELLFPLKNPSGY